MFRKWAGVTEVSQVDRDGRSARVEDMEVNTFAVKELNKDVKQD